MLEAPLHCLTKKPCQVGLPAGEWRGHQTPIRKCGNALLDRLFKPAVADECKGPGPRKSMPKRVGSNLRKASGVRSRLGLARASRRIPESLHGPILRIPVGRPENPIRTGLLPQEPRSNACAFSLVGIEFPEIGGCVGGCPFRRGTPGARRLLSWAWSTLSAFKMRGHWSCAG